MFHKILKTSVIALSLSTAAQAVPDTFLYVGELEQNGAPANGAFSVTFQMFDDATAGDVVYAEAVASLDVVDGALVYELGSSPSNPLDDADLAAGELYLSVIVNGTALEPRVPIRSVPFAQQARSATLLDGTPLSDVITRSEFSNEFIVVRRPIACGGGLDLLPATTPADFIYTCQTVSCGRDSTNQHVLFWFNTSCSTLDRTDGGASGACIASAPNECRVDLEEIQITRNFGHIVTKNH